MHSNGKALNTKVPKKLKSSKDILFYLINSMSMIEVNIMFILPRLIFTNGLLQFNLALLLICVLGYFVNVVYVDYAKHKKFSSFIEIIVSNKKNLKGVLFFFFFSLCFRKIIFNTVIFAENFLFYKKYYHLNKIGEVSFQIIVAIFYFIFII